MTSGNAAVETITSEPVIVEVPGVEKPIPDVEDKKDNVEDAKEDAPTTSLPIRGRSRSPAVVNTRVYYPERERRYSRSRSPIIYRRETNYSTRTVTILSNTISLNTILTTSSDECVETVKGRLVYITSNEFHTAELQKFSWLFQFGVPETWIQAPTSFLPGNCLQFSAPRGRGGVRGDYYDDDFDRYDNGPRGGPVAMAKLGAVLKIFGEDGKEEGIEKLKFLVILNSKNDAGWVKLLVCYSRQAAASEVCHALLNGHSIAFVGAVLQSVPVPADNPNKKARKLVRVGSVEEAENVDQGTVGVIC